ncbi:FtsH protease activity modulator HflK [uncultured Abyssibacter sp.]|uniref:FtsH protease activity modulator HflK n=1 Tax=uncultured Abyssibacter sp. TaxID=2320202 RepID=UPI0032B110F3
MAWNEPGNNGQDPWGRRGPNQGPPDLDEMLKKLRERFSGGGSGGSGGGGGGGKLIKSLLPLIIGGVVALWLLSGFYVVDEQQRGVVLQFGQYISTTEPGLRWHVPTPIQTVERVNVTSVNALTERASMLTQDENIVDVSLQVQYRVRSAEEYLFNVRDPVRTLKEATKSAIREVVGKSDMDFILTAGREAVAARTKELLQETIDSYDAGLLVTEVNLEEATAPQAVQGAFADAIKAREDQERLINEAQAYANDILPRARGAAARDIERAQGYRESVVAEAKGETARFGALLTEYKQAPQITRDRLYLDAMNDVLGSTSKIMIDSKDGNSLMYLPLDQMIQSMGAVEARRQSDRNSSSDGGSTNGSSSTNYRSTFEDSRNRGRR